MLNRIIRKLFQSSHYSSCSLPFLVGTSLTHFNPFHFFKKYFGCLTLLVCFLVQPKSLLCVFLQHRSSLFSISDVRLQFIFMHHTNRMFMFFAKCWYFLCRFDTFSTKCRNNNELLVEMWCYKDSAFVYNSRDASFQPKMISVHHHPSDNDATKSIKA